jgi:hypothetical protein
MLAPIILFVFKRPLHTKNILDSLSKNLESSKSIIYIYCDGPKNTSNSDEVFKINEVRKICDAENRFLKVNIIKQEHNKGLANSIIEGVTKVVNLYGKVIVLEDDLILSPYFLSYMNDSLHRYEKNNNVGQIGGCNYFAFGDEFPNYFFWSVPDSLGWGTWKNRWEKFYYDSKELYNIVNNRRLINKFNAFGAYDFMNLLKDQIDGKVDSWAIRWHGTCIVNDWKTLYSNPSMTNHIESIDATHAPVNILPPLCDKIPNYFSIRTRVLKKIIFAYRLYYENHPDSNQSNISNKSFFSDFTTVLKEKIHKNLKKIIFLLTNKY